MNKIPRKTIDRVFHYIRALERLSKAKRSLISSQELSSITGVSDVQIRKDISNFGKFGTPRLGYNIEDLKNTLQDFLLQKRVAKVVLFGVGNLGSAILKYQGFHQDKIELVAAFDRDKKKIGKTMNGVVIHALDEAPRIIKKQKASIGIIAVPGEAAQETADVMALAGLKGIVNFAPVSVNVPERIEVRDIDLMIEFLSLFCNALNRAAAAR